MASLGHVAIGMLAGRLLRPETHLREGILSARVPMLVFCGLAMLPDLDYVGVMLGVPDTGPAGHRGATHSLVPPVMIGLLAAALAPRLGLPRMRTAILAGLAVGSHLLLDAMTVSSRGVPLLWPFSFTRFEMPWRPIPNAPCGLAYVSSTGLQVASIELLQFLPLILLAFWPAPGTPARARNRIAPTPAHVR